MVNRLNLEILGVFFILGLSVSCGPMNGKPPVAVAPACANAGVAGGAAATALTFSQKSAFLVQTKVKNSAGDALPQPLVGDNQYVIRLVHSEDLHPVSKDAQITITYGRANSKTGKKFPAVVKKQDDGSFTSTITFKKPGNWEIDIHLTDGDVQDDQVIAITI